jgi:lysyl-tRNA synthetase class I
MVDCKKCGKFMGIEEIEEDDGSIRVTFNCDCGVRAQGYYNPEHQDPDPLFWENDYDKKKKKKEVKHGKQK